MHYEIHVVCTWFCLAVRPIFHLWRIFHFPGVDICSEITFSLLICNRHLCHSLPFQYHLSSLPWQRRGLQVIWQSEGVLNYRLLLDTTWQTSTRLSSGMGLNSKDLSGIRNASSQTLSTLPLCYLCLPCMGPSLDFGRIIQQEHKVGIN